MDADFNKKLDQACQVAEEFSKLYYKQMDKSRHLIAKQLYLENAVLTWNGNGMTGSDMIQKFITTMSSTEHNLATLDAQPIDLGDGKLSILVQASGSVKYIDLSDSSPKSFIQTFMISAVGDKWKIVSDSLRVQTKNAVKE